jgi:hypothetical protein
MQYPKSSKRQLKIGLKFLTSLDTKVGTKTEAFKAIRIGSEGSNPGSQSYDRCIYNCNAGVVVGYIVLPKEKKIFSFSKLKRLLVA